jgi:hypothetical protein
VEAKDTAEPKSPKKSPRKKLPREMELQEGMFSMSLPSDSPIARYDASFGKDSGDSSPRSSPRTSMFVETFYSAVVPGEQWKLSLQPNATVEEAIKKLRAKVVGRGVKSMHLALKEGNTERELAVLSPC